MKIQCICGVALVLGGVVGAEAFEYRARWVERIGNIDSVIGGDFAQIDGTNGAPVRVRLQIGVFDDAFGEAPAGGLLGWNVGTLASDTPFITNNRTPGRLAPFTFSSLPSANGTPAADPFVSLVDIDATLGTQSPFWGFDGENNPLPQPAPTVRGRNSFVSVYEFTTFPRPLNVDYIIRASGNLLAASEWLPIGTPTPPDPESMTPGSVTYAPNATVPTSFSVSLIVTVTPSPGAGALLAIGGMLAARRRRG